MGKRKIPGKKHHGTRDPLKHQALQAAKIKDKINNPPTGKDHQKVSRSFSQFIKLKEDTKKGKVLKRKPGGIEDKPKKNFKKIKPIKQLPEETDKDYLKRVNRATTESLNEAHYEAKYNVDIVRDPKTGEISIKKRPKDPLVEATKQKKKKGVKKVEPLPKVPKEVIKELLKSEKIKKTETELKEFQRDTFQFGEVVQAPPVLSTLPRKAERTDPVPRPGKKNNLILKNILNPTQVAEKTPIKKKEILNTNGKPKTTDLKGKRKDMPLGTRLMLEGEQSKAIEMYKQLKKNKLKTGM